MSTNLKIQAAISHGLGESLKIEEVELAAPGADEVLIKIVATGVCHTDAESMNRRGAPFPAVLGHEGAGIIEKVGSSVTNLQPGDHVVLSYSYCGECSQCLTGHQNLCERTVELNFGGKSRDGKNRIHQHDHSVSSFFGQSSFATYAIANKSNVVKVDKDVDLALLGPLGCGIQIVSGTVMNTLRPEPGTSIAIYGGGAVGLSAIMAAKIMGLKDIIVVDLHQNRLDLALELGATHALNGKEVDVVEEAKKYTTESTAKMLDFASSFGGLPIELDYKFNLIKDSVVGNRAWVTFANQKDGKKDRIELVKIDGDWLVHMESKK